MGSTSAESTHLPVDPEGPTGKLCTWVHSLSLADIPEEIRTRAKYLILDGLACGLVGAHLPWSERAANAMFDMDPADVSSVFGWNKKTGPLSAALLNSTFIQGFELDDWHSDAPLHSNSIILPALFAAAEHQTLRSSTSKCTGADFLLATIVGYEVGPRVGLGLYGSHMLTMGWHSGAVFGPAASAAAVSKLLALPANQIEDAIGTACTQACGLMSAQFESDVKRMQHGFAARNGLFAALLARGGYIGIKQVFERPYGGFLSTFGLGTNQNPPYRIDEITKGLSSKWQTEGIRVKPYAAMAGTHTTVDCIRALQAEHPEQMRNLDKVTSIRIEMGEAAFHHGGWVPKRPMTATGAQMSNAYVAATQLVDGQVLPAQFRHDMLERDLVWDLVGKTTCHYNPGFPNKSTQSVTIVFRDEKDGKGKEQTLAKTVEVQRGVDPALSNEEIREKWRAITKDVVAEEDEERMREIEQAVLELEGEGDIARLGQLMAGLTRNPIA